MWFVSHCAGRYKFNSLTCFQTLSLSLRIACQLLRGCERRALCELLPAAARRCGVGRKAHPPPRGRRGPLQSHLRSGKEDLPEILKSRTSGCIPGWRGEDEAAAGCQRLGPGASCGGRRKWQWGCGERKGQQNTDLKPKRDAQKKEEISGWGPGDAGGGWARRASPAAPRPRGCPRGPGGGCGPHGLKHRRLYPDLCLDLPKVAVNALGAIWASV